MWVDYVMSYQYDHMTLYKTIGTNGVPKEYSLTPSQQMM